MRLICLSAGLLLSLSAFADIYKSVDGSGHVTYSSTPSKGAKRLDLAPPVPRQTHSSRAVSPSSFPRVDGQTQRERDDMRRRILEQERATELSLLSEARAKTNNQADVVLHQKNIEALNSELARIK